MIITKTPFRISFFGGGTDYPVWFKQHGGAVLSTTINKYCYISCRPLPPFFEHKTRVIWSLIENVKDHEEIKHPAVRGILKYLGINEGLEIHHDADLPARTGMGTSSSFTVGLLHALAALKGQLITKNDLAKTAIHIEQNVLKENVGCQDQIATAIGGFNKIEFETSGDYTLQPITVSEERLNEFKSHLMLIFTGFSRNASEIAAEQIKATSQKIKELRAMQSMVDEAVKILHSQRNIADFGKLLDESWQLKRSLTKKVSNARIDEIYETAKKTGAIGGKLLGAGGGGFLLLFVKPESRDAVRHRFTNLLEVPFDFENSGSQIIFYKPKA